MGYTEVSFLSVASCHYASIFCTHVYFLAANSVNRKYMLCLKIKLYHNITYFGVLIKCLPLLNCSSILCVNKSTNLPFLSDPSWLPTRQWRISLPDICYYYRNQAQQIRLHLWTPMHSIGILLLSTAQKHSWLGLIWNLYTQTLLLTKQQTLYVINYSIIIIVLILDTI